MAAAISRGRKYNLVDLRNATVLGLSYVTGSRPVQLAKLAAGDFRIDTCSTTTGLVRYSVLLPYAKQRYVTTDRLILALPPEIGALVKHYIDEARLLPTDKMFNMGDQHLNLFLSRLAKRFYPLAHKITSLPYRAVKPPYLQ